MCMTSCRLLLLLCLLLVFLLFVLGELESRAPHHRIRTDMELPPSGYLLGTVFRNADDAVLDVGHLPECLCSSHPTEKRPLAALLGGLLDRRALRLFDTGDTDRMEWAWLPL